MAPHREPKKAPQPIPPIPALGKLHQPRKGNRAAALRIASGVRLWDLRHIERKARRKNIAHQEAQEQYRTEARATQLFLRALLKGAPSWTTGAKALSIRPRKDAAVQVEELLAAASALLLPNPTGRDLWFSVAGLTHREHVKLRAVLPSGITSHFIYHPRTATDAQPKDF